MRAREARDGEPAGRDGQGRRPRAAERAAREVHVLAHPREREPEASLVAKEGGELRPVQVEDRRVRDERDRPTRAEIEREDRVLAGPDVVAKPAQLEEGRAAEQKRSRPARRGAGGSAAERTP